MKKSTITVVCSFAALLYFLTVTPTVLTWYANLDAKHPEMANPVTSSERFASNLITFEALGMAFLPVFVLLFLAFTAWWQREGGAQHHVGRLASGAIPIHAGPRQPPSMGPAWPRARNESPPTQEKGRFSWLKWPFSKK